MTPASSDPVKSRPRGGPPSIFGSVKTCPNCDSMGYPVPAEREPVLACENQACRVHHFYPAEVKP